MSKSTPGKKAKSPPEQRKVRRKADQPRKKAKRSTFKSRATPNDKRRLNAILRSDFPAFIEKVFNTLNPHTPYKRNWHVQAIAHDLMEIKRMTNSRLIINQPPRSLKSTCTSVAFPAWLLGHHPGLRIVVASYSSDFADELHRQFRLVVNAPWYKELFPNMRVTKDTGSELITSKGGGRYATSVGGTFTGRGADCVIIDDPHKEDEAQSDVARKRVIDWFRGTILSRLNDKAISPIIIVQQRLHEQDLSGFLIDESRSNGWRHLKLPAIATERQVIPIGDGRFHTREVGEALQPGREDLKTLEKMKAEKGSYLFSAHYQQEPIPVEGNVIKRKWFRTYDHLPDREKVIVVQSWDIASTINETSDWSVCLTFYVVNRTYHLADVWRERCEFPDLRRMVVDLANLHRAETILIEDAGLGL